MTKFKAIYKTPIYLVSFLLSLGSIFGVVVDRVSGRSLDDIQFFKQGLTPDGVHYTVRTLRFLGFTDLSVLQSIKSQYSGTSIEITNYFLNPEPWESALVGPRLLYSILSTPFVKIFGLHGMFFVPVLSFLLLTLVPLYFNRVYLEDKRKLSSFFLTVILISSLYVKFNVLANTTDGLSTLLIVTLVLFLYRHFNHKRVKHAPLTLAFITLLTCMTRQNEIYVIGILSISLLAKSSSFPLRQKFLTIAPSIAAIISWLIYSFHKYSNYRIITSSSGQSLIEDDPIRIVTGIVISIPKSAVFEVVQLWIRDPGLFLIVLAALGTILYSRKVTELDLYFLWTFVAGMTLTAINAGIGSGFRYALPSIFLGVFVLLRSRILLTIGKDNHEIS